MVSFEDFCGGPIWNETELSTATWPQLTQCFQDSVLVWVPCGLFLVFGPIRALDLRSLPNKSLPLTPLNASKLFCQCAAALLTFVSLVQRTGLHTAGSDVYPVSYTADLIKILTFVGSAILGQYERRKGQFISRVQLATWTFFVLCNIVPAYSLPILEVYVDDFVGFVIFYINFALFIALFFLNCWSEHPGSRPGKQGYQRLEKEECPVVSASALSRTFFIWVFRMVRNGYKHDIEEEDMWTLPPELRIDSHLPVFERYWRAEERRCESYRKKKEYGMAFSPIDQGRHSSKHKAQKKPLPNVEKARLTEISEGPRSVYNHYLDRNTDDTQEEERLPQPSLMRVLVRQFWLPVLGWFWKKFASDLLTCVGPVLLNMLVTFLGYRTEWNSWQGYCICTLMLISGQLRIALFNCAFYESFNVGMQVKSVLITAIYKKAMRINAEAKRKSTVGDIVNLMSVDAQRLLEFMIKCGISATTPLTLIVAFVIIYQSIGPSVLVGFCVLLFLIPLNVLIATKQRQLFKQNLRHKDDRIRTVNEILNGIKVLKLYAWETSFHERVQALRALEIRALFKIALYYMVSGVCWNLAGFMITLATFTTYSLTDRENYLDPGLAFMTLAFFNILKPSMDFMSGVIALAAQAYVSLRRINAFLLSDELKEDNVINMPDSEHAVTFENTEFAWDSNSPSTLKNITLHVPQGQLVAVVGPVGAGKSSLISAVIGDMEKRKGTVTRKGSIAYVAQQAWIQNATVRDNITFGKTFRERKYKAVTSACELDRDFTILTAGDETEIGEKGINLSGGQKQRVSMARAVYNDCDLYLLDDPLSAVDSHVGKAMFDNVISNRGVLKNKTRILVTHGVHFLPQVDSIVVMAEGEISEMGTYEELLTYDGPFAQFLKTHLTQEQLDGNVEDEDPEVQAIKDNIWGRIEMLTSDAATSGDEARAVRRRRKETLGSSMNLSRSMKEFEEQKLKKSQGKLITTETLAKGRVSTAVYAKYLRAAGPVPLMVGVVMFWCFHATTLATNYWLTSWTEDPFLANRTNDLDQLSAVTDDYILKYGLFGILQGVFLVCYYYLFWTRMVMAGRNLHSDMTGRLFRAPMSFFDTTPTGRILNRCSRDIEVVDNFLPIISREFLSTVSINCFTILVILIETPIFGILLVPIVILFGMFLRFYIPTSRQLRRIESTTRSPIYTHFSESLSGSSTISAYGVAERFIDESKRRQDYNTLYFYSSSVALRWVSCNLDTIANIVIFAAGFFQVISPDSDSGKAGLAVSYALQLTGSLPWMVRNVADFETNIVSVERIKEYSEIEQESDWIVPHKRPLPNWPSHGLVEFDNFRIKYREGLDLVIRGITVKVEAGMKVGIVGRTGAGKSSLSLSLFRLMEASGGSISVDGINIADIGLHDLRSRLTILPQDPVMFSGSLRMNLDPFDEFNDEDLWIALERAHLKQFVAQLPDTLFYECGEEGQNLSVGQRQLVCLARTLLRKTKILILDEATAAVDMQTDQLIQNTIRLAFQNCTILAIAHRLNTILDYDRVMVLDAGLITEFDSPAKLLADPSSTFYSMAVDANLV